MKKVILFMVAIIAIPVMCMAAPIKVMVSILPQKYFVEQIGKDMVDVSVMVMPGASPATYEPKPSQLTDLAASKVYFSMGVPFEVWFDKASKKDMPEIVPMWRGIAKMPMTAHHHGHDEYDHDNHDGHGHDGYEEHDGHDIHHEYDHDDHDGHHNDNHDDHDRHDEYRHDGHDEYGHTGHKSEILDPHLWLSPPLVRVMAQNIYHTLCELLPEHQQELKANYYAFCAKVDQLDRQIMDVLSKTSGTRFMVFHPAFGYFARAYGLTQIPIESQGKAPGVKELGELIATAKKAGIKTVLAAPQFSQKSAKLIAGSIGGKVVLANPLALNWDENLLSITKQMAQALK